MRGSADEARAHKAANPDAYPIRDDVRELLPSMVGIEKEYGATDVHLQVFDGESVLVSRGRHWDDTYVYQEPVMTCHSSR